MKKAIPAGPIAQLVEHSADNAGVTGASPVRPTSLHISIGDIAQLGERQLCKLEVTGSIPVVSTNFAKAKLILKMRRKGASEGP